MSTDVSIETRALEVGYAGRALLPPLTFEVRRGEEWLVIGPNGAGKSTLVRTLLGLVKPVAGEVSCHDVMGYVPQQSAISPTVPMRVEDVVRLGTDTGWSFLRPLAFLDTDAAVERAMRLTGCLELADHAVRELSVGQRQRVLLARALVREPHLLVLDEPTASMDVEAERAVFELLSEIRREHDVAAVVVSHHLSLAARHATHAIVLDRERELAVSGTFHDVMAHERVARRYGDLAEHSEAFDEAER